VAAHLETEILLVDEVLAVGDAAFQEKCLGKMGNVASGGRTVLFVSHNMAAVRALCGSAMLLSEGQKVRVCDGSVDAVIAKYLQATIGEGRSGELVPSMHKGGSAELWVREVILTNGVGEPVSQLRIGEPMTITVLFEARQPFREARIGLGFITIEGTRIAAVYHTDRGLPALSANSGEYEVSFTLLNPFLPGSYIISAGAHRALGGTLIDDVPEALRFHVVDVSAGEDMPQSYNRGVVSLDGAWQPPQRIGG
jgi:lipopolysaccharide transport system ATP-binding protein